MFVARPMYLRVCDSQADVRIQSANPNNPERLSHASKSEASWPVFVPLSLSLLTSLANPVLALVPATLPSPW